MPYQKELKISWFCGVCIYIPKSGTPKTAIRFRVHRMVRCGRHQGVRVRGGCQPGLRELSGGFFCHFGKQLDPGNTVDGRNPAPPGMYKTL